MNHYGPFNHEYDVNPETGRLVGDETAYAAVMALLEKKDEKSDSDATTEAA